MWVRSMDKFNVNLFLALFPKILRFLPETFNLAILSAVFALLFAVLIAIIRQYRIRGLYALSSVYVSFFRCTPFVAQLFWFYYGLTQVFESIKLMSPFTALVICMSANYAAFMSEDIRAALNSVSKAQYEAGLSIGMKPLQVVQRIILPQAARVAAPGLSNHFIGIFKSTSIGFMIGYKDMMAAVGLETSKAYRFLEGYTVAIIVYWIILAVLSYGQKKLEKRLNVNYR